MRWTPHRLQGLSPSANRECRRPSAGGWRVTRRRRRASRCSETSSYRPPSAAKPRAGATGREAMTASWCLGGLSGVGGRYLRPLPWRGIFVICGLLPLCDVPCGLPALPASVHPGWVGALRHCVFALKSNLSGLSMRSWSTVGCPVTVGDGSGRAAPSPLRSRHLAAHACAPARRDPP
jgi:hypothetical protein